MDYTPDKASFPTEVLKMLHLLVKVDLLLLTNFAHLGCCSPELFKESPAFLFLSFLVADQCTF